MSMLFFIQPVTIREVASDLPERRFVAVSRDQRFRLAFYFDGEGSYYTVRPPGYTPPVWMGVEPDRQTMHRFGGFCLQHSVTRAIRRAAKAAA